MTAVADLKAASARSLAAAARVKASVDVLVRGNPTAAERAEMGAAEKEYKAAQRELNKAMKAVTNTAPRRN